MKYLWYAPNLRLESGKVQVPSGPEHGLEFDPTFLNNAVRAEIR